MVKRQHGSIENSIASAAFNFKSIIGRFLAHSGLPFRLAENYHFRRFIEELTLPVGVVPKFISRVTAARAAMDVAQSDFTATADFIRESVVDNGRMAMTMDYGSQKGTLKGIAGATVHFFSPSFSGLHEVFVACRGVPALKTSAVVADHASGIAERMRLPPSLLSGFTHDGGSNMFQCFAAEEQCMDVDCAAHLLSTFGKSVLNQSLPDRCESGATRTLNDIYSNAHFLVVQIRASLARREHFLNVQV